MNKTDMKNIKNDIRISSIKYSETNNLKDLENSKHMCKVLKLKELFYYEANKEIIHCLYQNKIIDNETRWNLIEVYECFPQNMKTIINCKNIISFINTLSEENIKYTIFSDFEKKGVKNSRYLNEIYIKLNRRDLADKYDKELKFWIKRFKDIIN